MKTILKILEYDDKMWSIAPGYGFGLIKGSTFSTIPSGYSINIISPYGFDIGPLYYRISFALGSFEAEYNKISTDNIGIVPGDTFCIKSFLHWHWRRS